MSLVITSCREYRGQNITSGSLSYDEQRMAIDAIRREGRQLTNGENYVRSVVDGQMRIVQIIAEFQNEEILEAFECCL